MNGKCWEDYNVIGYKLQDNVKNVISKITIYTLNSI